MTVIRIPNVLGGQVEDAERLHAVIHAALLDDAYVFDMAAIDFIKPHGAIALLMETRLLAKRTGRPILLNNLSEQVHLYLERMDLFDVGAAWLKPSTLPSQTWSRSPQTANLLELTPILGPGSVESAITRAERIFAEHLPEGDLGHLLNVLSEVCANVYQHSGDPHGSVLIQRYYVSTRGEMVMCAAVGDLGRGVRGSLRARHDALGITPLDYLRAALRGQTSRATGRGGMGLRRVEQIAGATAGILRIRSESAVLSSRGANRISAHEELAYLPGTQVVVEIRVGIRS